MKLVDMLPEVRELRAEVERLERDVQKHRNEAEVAVAFQRRAEEALDAVYARRRAARRGTLAMVAVVAVTAAGILAYSYGYQVGKDDAQAVPVQATPVHAKPPVNRDKPVQRNSGSPKTHVYAWAAVPGASAYAVSFIPVGRGSRINRQTRWTRLDMVVPPGRYRWYVWPIRDGVRDAVATTSARVTVP